MLNWYLEVKDETTMPRHPWLKPLLYHPEGTTLWPRQFSLCTPFPCPFFLSAWRPDFDALWRHLRGCAADPKLDSQNLWPPRRDNCPVRPSPSRETGPMGLACDSMVVVHHRHYDGWKLVSSMHLQASTTCLTATPGIQYRCYHPVCYTSDSDRRAFLVRPPFSVVSSFPRPFRREIDINNV